MSYVILRTATADEQLRDIAHYIATSSGSTSAALRFVDRIEEGAARLADFPRIGSVPHWGMLAKRGYRVLRVGEYLLLYTIDDEQESVTIRAVVHGRREYWRLV